jgi:ubiquinone/menaquinone biosynthesis C-methylase UbiE
MRDDDEITDVIRQHWNHRADGFDDEAGHGLVSNAQRGAWLDLLARLAGSAPRRVLDVGCGTGFLALRFAELGHSVTGIDLAPQMIGRAQRKAEQANLAIDFRVGNAAALDCPEEHFDFVVARHVIWNLPEPERGVSEWLRVLRPAGRLLLIEGKWANNDALALDYTRLASRLIARVIETCTALVFRNPNSYPRRLLYKRYNRIEAQLPFSGGPSAERLATFLQANGFHEVVVESLMNASLWGEMPQYSRYLVAATRPLVAG